MGSEAWTEIERQKEFLVGRFYLKTFFCVTLLLLFSSMIKNIYEIGKNRKRSKGEMAANENLEIISDKHHYSTTLNLPTYSSLTYHFFSFTPTTQVEALPTLILFYKGEVVERFVGYRSADDLEKEVRVVSDCIFICPSPPFHTHTYTNTHTHTHADTNGHTHTYLYIYIHTQTHTHINTCTHTHIYLLLFFEWINVVMFFSAYDIHVSS